MPKAREEILDAARLIGANPAVGHRRPELAAHRYRFWPKWLILATQLVLLRSRLLFPTSPQAASAAARDATNALARLEGMRFLQAAATWLDRRPQLGRDMFARPRRGPNPRVTSTMAR